MMKLLASTLFLGLIVTSSGAPCIWDYDTLAMERQQFPETLSLITGKFLRHSKALYEWRIQDRTKRILADKSKLALRDDLAVAYDKTGQHKKAIEVALRTDAMQPNRYETVANLGTFYIHDGQLERGLKEIKKALTINPNAHFGREEYQQLLVEFILETRKQKQAQSASGSTTPQSTSAKLDFPTFLFQKKNVEKYSPAGMKETEKAIKGIQGMMRFGNYDSPILLEALGDLLAALQYTRKKHPKRLAARAYLKASYGTNDASKQELLRLKAASAMEFQTRSPSSETQLPLSELEKTFESELDDAEKWFQKVEADELEWIKAGKNVDQEFSKKYYKDPVIKSGLPETESRSYRNTIYLSLICAGLLLVLGAAVVFSRKLLNPK